MGFRLVSYQCTWEIAEICMKYTVARYNKVSNYEVLFFLEYEVFYNNLTIQLKTVRFKNCLFHQISNIIKAHLWLYTFLPDALFLSQSDGKGLWKDDSFNKRKIKLKSRTSYSLASLDFKDEVKLFQSFQIAKLFSLQFLTDSLSSHVWGLH